MSGKLPDHIFSMFINDYDAEKATLIQKYVAFEQLDRFMLNELIERITIWETPNMGRYRKGKEKVITIYYKFVGALQ